jgi:hypothetical protein
MKKLITFLFTVMLTISLSAQDVRFGIVGGLNVAYPVGNDMEDAIEDFDDYIDYADDQSGVDAEGGIKPRIGMHLGFSVDFPIADNLYIGSGLIYSQKGFVQKMDYKNDGYSNTNFVYTGNSFDNYYGYPYYGYGYMNTTSGSSSSIDRRVAVQLNYIDLPIGVKYATDEGFELSGGIIVSILASDNVKAEIDVDGTGNDSYYEEYFEDEIGNDYEDLFDDDPRGFLTGLQLGVGYTFNEKFNVSFKVQKTGNFGEIDDEDDNQNLTLQLSTGLYF